MKQFLVEATYLLIFHSELFVEDESLFRHILQIQRPEVGIV